MHLAVDTDAPKHLLLVDSIGRAANGKADGAKKLTEVVRVLEEKGANVNLTVAAVASIEVSCHAGTCRS